MISQTSSHQCEASVVACIDFRYWKQLTEYVHKKLYIAEFDLETLVGGIKKIASGENEAAHVISEELEISRKLHRIKDVLLINHEECEEYPKDFVSKEEEFQRHHDDLTIVSRAFKIQFPELNVISYFAFKNIQEEIEFREICRF